MVTPFMLTTPVAMSTSASLLEQIPAFAKNLFNLIASSLKDGKGSPFLTLIL